MKSVPGSAGRGVCVFCGSLGAARRMSYAQAAQSLSEVEVPVSLLLPPNVSEKNLSKALDGLCSGRRRRARPDVRGGQGRVPGSVLVQELGRLRGCRGGAARDGRGDPGDRPDRQRAPGPAVGLGGRQEQRLRRLVSARPRLRRRQPAPDEPRARDQRGARLRGRRAGRHAGSTSTTRSRRAATSCACRSPISAGGASSATRSTTASPTCRTARTR